MNRKLVLIAALASGLALHAAAQVPAAPAPAASATASSSDGPVRVAVIAFQAAVAQTNEGQRDFADLEKKYDPKRQQLKALSDEIDTLTKQLQTQGPNLSQAEQTSRARTIDEKKKELDRSSQDAQSDFQQEMQETFGKVATKVYDVMQAYAQLKGYTVVLDVSQQQSPVLYAANDLNITKDVVDAYNQKSGIPAPPAAPAASSVPDAPRPAQPAASR
jgi:outer membrane protein